MHLEKYKTFFSETSEFRSRTSGGSLLLNREIKHISLVS